MGKGIKSYRNTVKEPTRSVRGRKPQNKGNIPNDVLTKLRELRSIRRSLTRAELEYIVNCFNVYTVIELKTRTSWTSRNLKSIKRRLYRTDEISDGYSLAGKFLNLDSVKDYFMELNKKKGFISPDPMKWLIEKLDYISYRYNTFDEEKLEQFRIAFSCPPRSSKSELLYAYCFRMLLEQPHLRIVYISNNQSNIKRASSIVRSYLRDCGCIFSSDINNSTSFVIDQVPEHTISGIVCGGSFSAYTSASIPQGISADVLIVDDLLSSLDEARSELRREKAIESFFGNMITRLTPFGVVIVVSTRYHQNDLIARITDAEFPDKYEYLNIPAIYIDDKGEEQSYWQQFWDIKKLQKIRKTLGERIWQALYLGNPRSSEDVLFTKCNRYEGQVPQGCQVIYSLDLAYSVKTKADYTAICKMYFNKSTGLYYVEKIWRFKKQINDTFKTIENIVGKNPIYFSFGGTENSIIDLSRNYNLNIIGERNTIDKYSRALGLSSEFSNVLFNSTIPEEYIMEIESFDGDPTHKDDIVDVVVTAFNMFNNKTKNIRSIQDIQKDMSSLFKLDDNDEDDD
jgi:hypothetical protein